MLLQGVMMLSKLLFKSHQAVLWVRSIFSDQQVRGTSSGNFVVGINFGGQAVTIEGDRWLAFEEALAMGLSMPEVQITHSSLRPSPGATYGISQMLNTAVFKAKAITLQHPLPDGPYDLYLWVMENYQSDWHSLKVSTGDQVLVSVIGQLKLGDWIKYGPYRVMVSQGHLNLTLTSNVVADAHLMGLSIFAANSAD